MTRPLLLPGQTIGVMAPSSYVERADIEQSRALLESRGYKVFIHPQTYERHHQSAGTVLQKSLALQGLWQRADIDAIWCAGGGNRAMHMLEAVNFQKMRNVAKPLIGFSDVTALLNMHYAQTGQVTYHGQVFKNLHKMQPPQLDHMLHILSGVETHIPMTAAQVMKPGNASGPLVGGNLSLFQYMMGAFKDNQLEGSILFLEDCNEELSRIDRMLLHLKRSGVFDAVKAIVFGEFIDLSDSGTPYGFSFQEILQDHLEGFDGPVLTDAPFGHGKNLYCFPIGQTANLEVSQEQASLILKM